jgi:ubiquinone/menaquinone biosynthesis C-methylase UbiE
VTFTDRASYYADCRPGYPDPVLEYLRRDPGLPPGAAIVDVGSGTGLSAELFLRHGHRVHGVEPDAAMRRAAERRLSRYPAFHSVAGRAEATTLPDACADLIVCASAFHWFDADAARTEFRRLLRPAGAVAIMRNGRGGKRSPFMRAYSQIFRRYAARVDAREQRIGAVRDFFAGNAYRTAVLEYREELDFARLEGRILSYATIPLPGQPGHQEMLRDLRTLFDHSAEGGRIEFWGEITLHVGRLA